MRRLLSIMLLLAFLLPGCAPLLAMATHSEDARLPACCRRDGKHHCMMSQAERQVRSASSAKQFTSPLEKCPYCPATIGAAQHGSSMLPATSNAAFSLAQTRENGVVQTESRQRLAQIRSRQKRGPPVLSVL